MNARKKLQRMALVLLGTGLLAYTGLLVYAWNEFGASPAEVNDYLSYTILGKGRLKPAPAPAPATTRDGRWAQDLHYLKTELARLHANAFHHVNKADWESSVDTVTRRIPDLSDAELRGAVMELVAMIGDGHTKLAWWMDEGFPQYPLRLAWFGQELRVQATSGGQAGLLGARLDGVGGKQVQEAIKLARRVSSRESDVDAVTSAAHNLLFPDVQYWLGLRAGEFELTSVKGPHLKVHLAAVPWRQTAGQGQLLELSAANLRDEQPEKLFWFRNLNHHTVYLRYRSCDDKAGFAALSAELLPVLEGIPAASRLLIVDMRDNGGGNSAFFNPLLRGLQQMKFGQGGGRVAVLVNRFTYSSALLNTVTLKTRFNARLYGEPSAENLTSYGEVRTFTLPNSKLVIQYSTRLFRLAPELGDGLLPPDVPVTQSFDQYMKGIDPVLDAALKGS